MNPNYSEFKFPSIKAHPWKQVFHKRTPPEAIDLITKVLVYEPAKRLLPLQVLAHSFFDELRDENTRIPNGNRLPDLFDFSDEEKRSGGTQIMEKLIPQWYRGKTQK